MDSGTENVTLFFLLGSYQFYTAVGFLLLIVAISITAFFKYRKLGRQVIEPSVFLALSAAIFFWGHVASHWSSATFQSLQRLTGGTDFATISLEHQRYSIIQGTFSFVAFVAALVSAILYMTRTPKPNKPE